MINKANAKEAKCIFSDKRGFDFRPVLLVIITTANNNNRKFLINNMKGLLLFKNDDSGKHPHFEFPFKVPSTVKTININSRIIVASAAYLDNMPDISSAPSINSAKGTDITIKRIKTCGKKP